MLPVDGRLQKILDLAAKAKAALYVEDIETAYQAQIDIEVCVQEICAIERPKAKNRAWSGWTSSGIRDDKAAPSLDRWDAANRPGGVRRSAAGVYRALRADLLALPQGREQGIQGIAESRHWDDTRCDGSPAEPGGSCGAWGEGPGAGERAARSTSCADRAAGGGGSVGTLDCARTWHHAENGEWLANFLSEQGLAGLIDKPPRGPQPKYEREPGAAFWRCWISHRPRGTPAGLGASARWCGWAAGLAFPAVAEDRPCGAISASNGVQPREQPPAEPPRPPPPLGSSPARPRLYPQRPSQPDLGP